MFEDWKTHRPEEISKALLWEYDTDAPTWDWEYMKPLVVERVIERGNISDYYALLQRYGGFGPVSHPSIRTGSAASFTSTKKNSHATHGINHEQNA